jgi:DNA-binding response OmpR family regulator
MARVKSVLRRTANTPSPESDRVHVGPLTIDATRHDARWGAITLDLTALEFDLLHTLARHVGQVLTREQLLEQVWGYDYFGDLRAVDAAIKRLRAKLRQADPAADPIVTIRSVGYKLSVGGD